MVGLSALWMPIVVSAVFVFIALLILHMMPGWHKDDMKAVPGEDNVMETLRGLKCSRETTVSRMAAPWLK